MVTLQSPIPDAIPSAEAAPMLCGGVTTYSPLKDNGAGPGKRVGIIGIGGLGHFGLLWAKALGCDKVVAISRKSNKKADALKMGADAFIATDEDEGWVQNNQNSLDLIVCTVSGPNLPLVDLSRASRCQRDLYSSRCARRSHPAISRLRFDS
jgi:alcohol dehydrogenase (NADP+)